MAHFARLDENNIVTQVIVLSDTVCVDENGNESEEVGIAFCKSIFGENTNWKQTSYNHNIRVRYASIGHTYDEELDAFIPPQPFPSWTLNRETCSWESPLGPIPVLSPEEKENHSEYEWDEENVCWIFRTTQNFDQDME